jgi:thiopurine S-methyltransferase
MSLNFWSKVWEEGVIRFHQSKYNNIMTMYFDNLDLTGKVVLVPLAGKTRDINYFLEKGAVVIAVEFYENAIKNYFSENNIAVIQKDNVYKAKNLMFYREDFFNFSTDLEIDYIYDRASIVVFGIEERNRYTAHLASFMKSKTELLIYSIDHSGPTDFGPPYKIPLEEMKKNFQEQGVLIELFHKSIEKPSDKMAVAGINEVQYLVMKRVL